MKNLIAFSLISLAVVSLTSSLSAGEISFNRDIRPILSDRCYYCHGFDENHREADLRLDIRDQAEYVWDVNAPDESELIARITSDNPDSVMPPPEAHKQALTESEVATVRQWIAQGAVYEPHWAFVAPTRRETQTVHTADAIDEFVSRRHREHGLEFAPPSLPTKWLRRAALDLTGVPPTTEQLDAFSADVADRWRNRLRRSG